MSGEVTEAIEVFRGALRNEPGERFASKVSKDFNQQVGELNRKLIAIQKRAGVAQKTFIRKISIDLLRKIIEKNPVNTGRSRAAWAPLFTMLGEAIPEAAPPTLLPENQGEPEGSVEESGSDDNYYLLIANNVPYVVYLEYGTSDQAPEGMVRISMMELLDELRRTFK